MPYGTARPSSLIRKSCTRTSSGWPWRRHSRPPFLKSPTSSFFFVSTEITGCCSASAAETLWLMSANCASRSGWLPPSLVLQLACRLNFCCFSSSPTTVWLIRWPRAASSLASRRRLLQVQRSGDIGSPRSLGATSASRSSSRAASVATSGLRPPPGRRTRSASSRAAVASSFKPRPIVLTAMPVARDTAAIPPYPAVRASVAANSRRRRSSRWGNSKVKRARMPVGSIIPTRYGIAPRPRIQPSAPIHLFPDSHLVDPSDPIATTYQRAFPNLLKPLTAMPPDLQRHIRYPQDLFFIQAQIYRAYHMTAPEVFYNREDLWELPRQAAGGNAIMDPYYMIMRLPGESKAEFILMVPMVPSQRENMIAWLAARCDPPHYGELIVYEFPKDKLVFGPFQIEARINQNTTISQQLSLWNQHGSRVIRGNLHVIPIEDAILYVLPLYLRAEKGQIPELKRVIAAFGDQVVMEETLPEALAALFRPSDHPP